MNINPRIVAAGLALSAAAFIKLATSEGWSDTATIPTVNDRATYGFGSTFHEDGSPVKLGERITPVRAIVLAGAHISKEEAKCRDLLPGVALHQGEYDLYCGDWIYQYGSGAFENSAMRQDLLVGNYWRACHDLLLYRRAGGYDCSTLVDGKRNTRCWGVWERQLKRYSACLGAQ